jgi:hypothetical protein
VKLKWRGIYWFAQCHTSSNNMFLSLASDVCRISNQSYTCLSTIYSFFEIPETIGIVLGIAEFGGPRNIFRVYSSNSKLTSKHNILKSMTQIHFSRCS